MSTATTYQDLIAEVALRYAPDETATIECGSVKKAHNHYVYLRRAREGVIRRLPQARNVDIARVGSTVVVSNTYDPDITVTRTKLSPIPTPASTAIEERSQIDPSERERFLRLMKEDYEDGEMSMEAVLEALSESNIPKEEVSWL